MSLTNGKILKNKSVNILQKLNEAIYTTDLDYGKSIVNVDALNDTIGDIDIPNIINVGSGADIYKGLNGNNQEFRGITVEMIPPTDGGQLTGTPTAIATVDGDNVKVTVNLSSLTVTSQTFGIPEYYVNTANSEDGDGSAVNPFRTWELCKTEIGGTPDTNRNIKVIFQSNITSSEDITLNGVNFVFENSSIFTYSGNGAIIDFSKFTGSTSKQITLSGNGSLRQSTSKTATLNAINVVGGNGTFSRTLNIEGNIELFERVRVDDPSTDSDFVAVDRLDGANAIMYGYNEPFIKGTIYVTGRNSGGTSLINIRQGAILTIRDAINPTIEMNGTGSGTSSIVVEGTLRVLHHTKYIRYSSIGGTSPNTYLNYSNNIPRMIIEDGYNIISNNGIFQASHTGSTNSGGYSSLVRVTGSQPGNPSNKSSFRISNNSSFILSPDVYYRFLFEVDNDSIIEIDNINSRNSGFGGTVEVENIIYSPSSASPTITLRFGNMLWGGTADFLHSNISSTPITNWLFVQGQPVSSSMGSAAMSNLDNNIYTNSGILTRD